ncbi:MAG: nucleoid occlusion protein [Pelosinus sp.]|nr:nucleoid occlusion protein [Pelosinus sp.]
MKNLARFLGLGSDKPIEANQAEQTQDMKENAQPSVPLNIAEADLTKAQQVSFVNIDNIAANPFQPRKSFPDESLAELSASIKEYGVIQPLLVRRTVSDIFELVAGERRLRASKLAGLQEVPVIVKEFGDKEMAELAMIENLQREDLHYLEEAEGFQHLIANFAFTQEELAQRMGKKQSTIANKMRLLRLAPEVRAVLRTENLTERHARSLLKLEDTEVQLKALDCVREKGLNVRATEDLVEEMLDEISREGSKKKDVRQNYVKVIKDVRIFLNTINHVVGEMKKSGLKIKVKQEQDDEFIVINMRIPKRK